MAKTSFSTKIKAGLPNWKYLKRAFSYAKGQQQYILLVIVLTILVSGLNALEPLIMKYIFDQFTHADPWQNIILGLVLFVALAITREVLSGFSNYQSWSTRLHIHYGLLNATVEKLHQLSFSYHREEGVGATMTKLERAIQNFVTTITNVAFQVLPSISYLLISLLIMLQLDWRMTLLVAVFTPLPVIIAALASPPQVKRERVLLNIWGNIYSRFNEVLSGILTVRSFTREDYEKERFLHDVDKANSIVVKGVSYDSKVGALQNLMVTLARIAAIALGGYLVIVGEITLGTLIAFLGYVNGLFGPVQGLTQIYKNIQTATASLDHIFSILDTDDYIGDPPLAPDIRQVEGKVSFINIHTSFESNGQKQDVLKGVNIEVRAGENLAIVGPSGSGKSTLMALLQRFIEPDQGEILIDDINIKDIRQKSIRKYIGVVPQDAILFNDSIKTNIAYGNPKATFNEIKTAAHAANAHLFINRMSEGYQTRVGERGNRLSFGERQRIAIARAILKNPPVLILDEATSALDVETESLVQEALQKLMQNRTSFIIAHRLSTVVNADRIIVIKDGKVKEAGNHRQLMQQQDGYYAYLVNKQMKGFLQE